MSEIPVHDMTKSEHEHRWIEDFRKKAVRKGVWSQQEIIRCTVEGCGEVRDVQHRPKPTRLLSEDEFFEEFSPDNNGGSFYSWMAIKNLDPHYVWTIVEPPDDPKNNLYAIPGVRIVNKIDYVVCAKPWTDDIIEAIYMDREQNFGKDGK